MKIVSIIPARAGSKGIKNKNIINLANKPLIEHTFIASSKSIIRENYVLTDSKKIKTLASKYKINTTQLQMVHNTSLVIVLFTPLLSQTDMRDDFITSDFYYKSGVKYTSNGNYKKAIESFKKSIEIFSDNPDAYRELATVYKHQGN